MQSRLTGCNITNVKQQLAHRFHKLLRYSLLAHSVLFKPLKPRQLPTHVQIEVTTYCNQDCLSCGRRDIIHQPKHMRFKQFKKIYDEIKPVNINLSGLGEPLLNPDIFDMIKYCRQHQSIVNFPTNLTLNENIILKLIDTQINQIKVSIDAFSRDTYLIVRQSDKLNIVKRNIELINQIKKERKLDLPELRLNYAFQKANMHELLDIIDYAYENNIATIYVQDLNYFSVESYKPDLCGFNRTDLENLLAEAERRAQDYGIKTNIRNWQRNMSAFYNKTLPKEDYEENDKHCTFPWVSVFIDVDGNVKPCPVFVWDKHANHLGNCLETDFKSIWRGQPYQTLRQEFRRNIRSNKICQRCVPPNIVDMNLIFNKMLLKR